MKRIFRFAVIGVAAATFAASGGSLAAAAHHRGHKHWHGRANGNDVPVQGAAGGQSAGDRPVTPGSVGSFYGGLGTAYDNSPLGYDGPLGGGLHASAQIGSALVGGGALGDAYANYVQHLYYYKYDYCPLGSSYVWYLQRCVSPFDLFR